MTIGNHALIALSSAFASVQFMTTTHGRGWALKLLDKEPIVFFSCLLGGVGAGCVVASPPHPRLDFPGETNAPARAPAPRRSAVDRRPPPRRMVLVVPPVRRALGMSTSNLDGQDNSTPKR